MLESWLAQKKSTFKPTIFPEGKAYKELDPHPLYPTLGIDTTMLQFRAPEQPQDTNFGREQEEFPVWYFFYSTLASPPKLRSVLGLPGGEVPALHEAKVRGGQMETGRG